MVGAAVARQVTGAFVLEVMTQLTLGVAHMHSCGILHRDLKADNALIQSLDPLVIKWGDFGCAVELGKNQYGSGMFGGRSSLPPSYCFTSLALA